MLFTYHGHSKYFFWIQTHDIVIMIYQALDLNHRHLAGGSVQSSLEDRELDGAFVVFGLGVGYSVTQHVQSGVRLSDIQFHV